MAAARVDGRNRTRTVTAVHVVRKGDTLWSVAQKHSMDVNTLARLNNMKPNTKLRAGQKLKLHSDTTAKESSKTPAKGKSADTAGKDRRVTYVVKSGDTLFSIARTLRVNVDNLRQWNKLGGVNDIRPGQKLIAFVPSSG